MGLLGELNVINAWKVLSTVPHKGMWAKWTASTILSKP